MALQKTEEVDNKKNMLKGPPHVGRSNLALPSIYKVVHDLPHSDVANPLLDFALIFGSV